GGAQTSGRNARLRRVPPQARAARARDDAGRSAHPSRRRVGREDAPAVGGSGGACGRLRQGAMLCTARLVPAGAAPQRLLRREVQRGSGGEAQRRPGAPRVLRPDRELALHLRRFGSGSLRTMTLTEKVNGEIAAAMKAKNQGRLSALRMLKA